MRNIKDKVINLCNNKRIDYVVIIIIGLILSIPLNNVQLTVGTHDGLVHLMRIKGAVSALNIQQFPPLIVPDMCLSSGYAMILFYNPLVTYIPLIIYAIVQNYFITMKLFAILCIITSGITMYFFAFNTTNKRQIAIITAILYITVPYLLGNIYVRGAMGEFAALAFLPLTFIGLDSLLNKDGKRHYFISIGAILVILSHTITSLYLAMFCFLFLLINIKKIKNVEIIKKLVINLLFIIIITMFFWIPVLEAKNSAEYGIFDNKLMGTNSRYSSSRALNIKTLFNGEYDDEHPTMLFIGIPTILLLLLSIYSYRKIDKNDKNIYLIFMIFSMISLFMTTKLFPWKQMPNIVCKLQFPWRMLGFFGFFSSYICGINLYIIMEKISIKKTLKATIITAIFLAIIIYVLNIIYRYIVVNEDGFKDNDLNPYMYNQEVFIKVFNTEYLPKKIIDTNNEIQIIKRKKDKCTVLKGSAHITVNEKKDLSLIAKIQNATENAAIEFPFIFYPGYEVSLMENDTTTKLQSLESENGYVMVSIDKKIEEAEIKVEYKGTILTKVSYIISFIGIICFSLFLAIEKKKMKENTTQTDENVLK